MAPSRQSLQAILEGCGIRLDASQLDRLWHYHRLLRLADAELNLTRIRNFENMVLKHYVDSLLALRFGELPSPLVDMGSGPGLPGVPLKIARPGVEVILAEPRHARAEFLEKVCAELKLEGTEVFAGKVNSRFPRRAKGIITRAVATIPETLDLVSNALEPGGRMIFMKGPGCDAEISEARRDRGELFRFVADHHYTIPGTTHDRRLVIFERTGVEASRESVAVGPAPSNGPVREVSSAANPTMKLARELLSARGIRKHGLALISGAKVVAEVLERHRDRVEAWISPVKGQGPPVADLLWYRLAEPLFQELDVAGTHSPMLLVRVPAFERFESSREWPAGCTLFVPFQDPENVGAVIRSAVAFGVRRVVLLREAAHPFHPRAVRAAGTSLLQVELQEGPSIRELAASEATPIYALDASGSPLPEMVFPERFGLLAGVEGPGLPEAMRGAPTTLRIPIAPGVESLNAATAVAVALYAWKSSGAGT